MGLCKNRFGLRTGFGLLLTAILLIASAFTKDPNSELRSRQMNLIIRQIGDRLLLQSGDSSSRVLPVREIKDGRFVLRFEKEFVFNHDSLMMLTKTFLPKTNYPSGYTVTVFDCLKKDIVYGFQVNNTSADILSCSGRNQPSGCYSIEFFFPELYDNVSNKNLSLGRQTKESKSSDIVVQNILPTNEEEKKSSFNSDIALPSKGQGSKTNDVSNSVNSKPAKTLALRLMYFVAGGIFLLSAAAIVLFRFGKKVPPPSYPKPAAKITKHDETDLPTLGRMVFNSKEQYLKLDNTMIRLTDKECKLLELLHANFGELISRETLLQKIWIDEGVITGRSLDMFVSKLRKKLIGDPKLRITNVHGKGYKLEYLNEV